MDFGAQVYEEFVQRGERKRFSYADAQILKSFKSIDELRRHCEAVSERIFDEETTAVEMVQACIQHHPDKSDVESYADAFTTSAEGCCIFAVVYIPLAVPLLLGLMLGTLVRKLGLSLQHVASAFPIHLRIIVIATAAGSAYCAWSLHLHPAFWGFAVTALIGGMLTGRLERSEWDIVGGFIGLNVPVAIGFISFQEYEFVAWEPLVTSAICCGFGYGICREPEDLFEKQKGAEIKNGRYVLQLSKESRSD